MERERGGPIARYPGRGWLRVRAWAWPAAALAWAWGCTDDVASVGTPVAEGGANNECSIPASEIFNGGPGKDGIPALTNPTMVSAGDLGVAYLKDRDRVVGLIVGDQVLAIPLNILWWHEIVNLTVGERHLAVTHCPLTGSSLVFDRSGADLAELGVSGLLYRNNLIMYDRNSPESLWPQMSRSARCGPRSGTQLAMFPSVEMTWAGWRTLHPDTRVVSSETGHSRNYTVYPYGSYAVVDNPHLLFPLDSIDPRRPPKERVLGTLSTGAITAYPFGELARLGDVGVVADGDVVILWDGGRQAAMAFSPVVDGTFLRLRAEGGKIVDLDTRSVWSVDGTAVEGPLAGRRLEMIPTAYVAYWFAWAAFEPFTFIWGAEWTP